MAYITGMRRDKSEIHPQFIVAIDKETCIGCGRCYKVCVHDVLAFEEVDEEDSAKDVHEGRETRVTASAVRHAAGRVRRSVSASSRSCCRRLRGNGSRPSAASRSPSRRVERPCSTSIPPVGSAEDLSQPTKVSSLPSGGAEAAKGGSGNPLPEVNMLIAVASRDGNNINQHFGHAERFLIYEVAETRRAGG